MVNGDGGWWGVGAQAGGRMQRSRTWRDDRTHPASVEREQVPTPSGRRPAASDQREQPQTQTQTQTQTRAGGWACGCGRSIPSPFRPSPRRWPPHCQSDKTAVPGVKYLCWGSTWTCRPDETTTRGVAAASPSSPSPVPSASVRWQIPSTQCRCRAQRLTNETKCAGAHCGSGSGSGSRSQRSAAPRRSNTAPYLRS